MPQLRAVAYYRKSNDDDGSSIDQQREWAHTAAQKEGVEIVREFADQAKKGHENATRTAFQEMLRFCQEEARRRAPIQAVVCWHTNRFSRADSQETGWYVWEFRKAGVSRLLTAQKWIDFARGEDRIIFGVNQEAGDHKFILDMAQATARGRVAAALAGRWAGGPPPLGYRIERQEVLVKGRRRLVPKRLVLGPDWEVDAVRLIFRLYVDTPAGIRGVAEELTRRGIPTQKGKAAWSEQTVKQTLDNPVYVGRLAWNRRQKGKFVGVIDGRAELRPGDGREKQTPASEWICGVPDDHQPIIDLTTWERAQAKRTARRGTKAAGGPERAYLGGQRPVRGGYLLTGLLRCGKCDHHMIGRSEYARLKDGGTRAHRHYICSNYSHCGKAACDCNAVNADAFAKALLRKLREELLGPDNLRAMREEAMRQDAAEGRPEPAKARRLRQQAERLAGELAAGVRKMMTISDALLPAYQAQLEDLQKERDRLLAEADRLEAAAEGPSDLEALADGAEEVLRQLDEAEALGDHDLLRDALGQLIERVDVLFTRLEPRPGTKRVRTSFFRALVYLKDDALLKFSKVCRTSKSSAAIPTTTAAPGWPATSEPTCTASWRKPTPTLTSTPAD
jgi:site-specific DNA recombinase